MPVSIFSKVSFKKLKEDLSPDGESVSNTEMRVFANDKTVTLSFRERKSHNLSILSDIPNHFCDPTYGQRESAAIASIPHTYPSSLHGVSLKSFHLTIIADNLQLEVRDARGTYRTGPSSVIVKGPWGNMLIQLSTPVGKIASQ